MTAREQFQRGDRVRESAHYRRLRTPKVKPARTGTVIGFGRSAHVVTVQRDGQTTPIGYHCSWWEKVG